jgi:acetyl esterase/lipase
MPPRPPLPRLRPPIAWLGALTLALATLAVWTVPGGTGSARANQATQAERTAHIEVRRGVRYASTRAGGRDLALDAYLPAGGGAARPAVVLVHGGAWRRGDRSLMEQSGRLLARRGYASFAIDYRRDARHPFPGAVHDVARALAFVRANAGRFGIDPGRVSLLGASAGGNLAALAATDARAIRIAGGRPAAVVTLSGPMDLRAMAADAAASARCAGGPGAAPGCSMGLSVLARLPIWIGCPVSGRVPWPPGTPRPPACPAVYDAGSPVRHASRDTPPMLLVHGSRDALVSPRHTRLMSQALTRRAVPHEVVIVAGDGHGKQLVAPALDRILGALED